MRQRGYPWKLLNRSKNIAKSRTRQQHLFSTKSNTDNDNRLVFSTPYIVHIIKMYLPVLHQYPILDSILSTGVNFVAKRGKSLASITSPTVIQPVH